MTDAGRPAITDRVIEAARDLFYAQGYDVSVDRIVQQASVAKPTVYAHFGSKDALIEAVLDAARTEFFDQLEVEIATRPGDPVAQLLAPIDLLVQDLPDASYHGCLCINAAATFPDPSHPAHRVLRDLNEQLLSVWTRLAARAGAKQPDVLARQMVLLFDGIKARGLTDHDGAAADDARAAVRILLNHNRRTRAGRD